MLQGLGIETGIDLQQLVQTGNWISAQLGRVNGSKVGQALACSH
jgi:hydroxymethylglutaryl-CoA lyase